MPYSVDRNIFPFPRETMISALKKVRFESCLFFRRKGKENPHKKLTPAQPHGGIIFVIELCSGRELPARPASLAADSGRSLPVCARIPPVVSSRRPADFLPARALPRSHTLALGRQDLLLLLQRFVRRGERFSASAPVYLGPSPVAEVTACRVFLSKPI